MDVEGGFQGRTNKLVDACYSFWQGATPALLSLVADEGATSAPLGGGMLFDRSALQEYILACGQQADGGLRDKPNKYRDFYHTCYALSGLSVAQWGPRPSEIPVVVGDQGNLLKPTSCIYNIRHDKLQAATQHFCSLPCSHEFFTAPAAGN